jgi:glycerol uptake facilitator-like aquaporin
MKNSLMGRCLVEALATGFLSFAISSISHSNHNDFEQAIVIGLTLALLIHLCGRFSGAHFNPLVSFMLNGQRFGRGAWSSRVFWRETMGYSVAQCVGAVVGFRLDPPVETGVVFSNAAFAPELCFSVALLALVLTWSREGRVCPFSQPLSGVVIGMGLSGLVVLGGLTECGVYNPAISVALMTEGAHGIPLLIMAQGLALGLLVVLMPAQEFHRNTSLPDSTSNEISSPS